MKIGIDIGGSHIGVGLIDKEKIIWTSEKNFNREDRQNVEETILNSIEIMIDSLLEENKIKI